MSYHLVFTAIRGPEKQRSRGFRGNFGALGLLEKGHLVETDRAGLVGGYVGQTALKTQAVVQQALACALCDEAYALARRQRNGFGHEAVDTVLKMMEDHREQLDCHCGGLLRAHEDILE